MKKRKDYKLTRVIHEVFYIEAYSKKEAEMIARESNDPRISHLIRIKVELDK